MCSLSLITDTDCADAIGLDIDPLIEQTETPALAANSSSFSVVFRVALARNVLSASVRSGFSVLLQVVGFAGSMVGLHAVLRTVLRRIVSTDYVKAFLFSVVVFIMPFLQPFTNLGVEVVYGATLGAGLALSAAFVGVGYFSVVTEVRSVLVCS
jgi:hypothetical protein